MKPVNEIVYLFERQTDKVMQLELLLKAALQTISYLAVVKNEEFKQHILDSFKARQDIYEEWKKKSEEEFEQYLIETKG